MVWGLGGKVWLVGVFFPSSEPFKSEKVFPAMNLLWKLLQEAEFVAKGITVSRILLEAVS